MKILLVNNHTRHLESLNESLAGHDVETQMYRPGIKFHYEDKDLVILSGGGGEGLEIYDEFKPGKLWHEDQMKFVLTCEKPIIGICMGFEVICRAYGANIKKLDKIVKGFVNLKANDSGAGYLGKKRLKQFESHEWYVPEVDSFCLDVLAESNTGVELVKHKTRNMIATQFHPEKGGTVDLKQLISAVGV
ncbi:hypothetical protein KW803_01095 [Candidatus Saccharibacteria bacterium]|nr:hypothetical protein [Candidatus Saccharibacteria bacterium]